MQRRRIYPQSHPSEAAGTMGTWKTPWIKKESALVASFIPCKLTFCKGSKSAVEVTIKSRSGQIFTGWRRLLVHMHWVPNLSSKLSQESTMLVFKSLHASYTCYCNYDLITYYSDYEMPVRRVIAMKI